MSQMAKPGPDPDVSDDKIIEVIREVPYPVAKTSEVAREIGMTDAGALRRLHQLADAGYIGRRKIAHSAVIWWHED